MTDLHYLTAAEALRLFRARDLSPVELVGAVIKRAEAVEPVINAFAETSYEQALHQARRPRPDMRIGAACRPLSTVWPWRRG